MWRCFFYFTTQRTGLLPLLYKGPGGFSRPEYRLAMLSSLPGASPSASPGGIDAREKPPGPLYSNGIFFFAPGAAKRLAQARARISVWPRPLPAAAHWRRNRRRTRAPAQARPQETACFLPGAPVLRRGGAAQKEKPARLRTRRLCFVYHGPGRDRAAPAGRGHSSIRSWSFSSSRYFTVSFR